MVLCNNAYPDNLHLWSLDGDFVIVLNLYKIDLRFSFVEPVYEFISLSSDKLCTIWSVQRESNSKEDRQSWTVCFIR